MAGNWWLGSRGTNPRPWDRWAWTRLEGYGPDSAPSLDVLAKMVEWAAQGQHVRLEFVPEGIAVPED